jgi:hypothetical protein
LVFSRHDDPGYFSETSTRLVRALDLGSDAVIM